MSTALVEAWQMSHEANRFLIGQIPEAYLGDRYSSRTRTVGQQFAHVHAVRLRWLEVAGSGVEAGIATIHNDTPLTKEVLLEALEASAVAIAGLLERCDAAGRVPGWKGPPASFMAYLVAHEAHHRGLAMVAMRLAGHKLPQEVVYGQWDWGKRYSHR